MEGTDQVLALRRVDAGFAADRGIDLGDDGGGDLDEGKSAVENGGYEASQIAHDAAAERDDDGFPVMSGADHFAGEGFRMDHRLRGLACGHCVQRGVETFSFKRREQRFRMQGGHGLIADDRRATPLKSGRGDQMSGFGERSGFDDDIV